MRPKGHRERKCGPDFKLLVVQCKAHGACFTLYPVGWVPYGRMAIAPSPPARSDVAETSSGLAWDDTAFGVVPRWLASSTDNELSSYRRTRTRQVASSAQWLGLTGTVADAEFASAILSRHLAVWTDAREAYQSATRWRSRAATVERALSVIVDSVDLWRRMLRVGHRMGACGPGWWVDVSTGALVPLVPAGERTALRAA